MNTEPGRTARILLVDDHRTLRTAVRRLLEGETDLAVCGEAESIQTALDGVSTLKPDLVIVDLSLGNENGLELISRLRTLDFRLPVVVFSSLETATYAELAFMAGARGYVMKRELPGKLIKAIRDALKKTGGPRAPETL